MNSINVVSSAYIEICVLTRLVNLNNCWEFKSQYRQPVNNMFSTDMSKGSGDQPPVQLAIAARSTVHHRGISQLVLQLGTPSQMANTCLSEVSERLDRGQRAGR